MDLNCSTCLETLNKDSDTSSTPCGHVFHTPCITEWLYNGNTCCPHCRSACVADKLRQIHLPFSDSVFLQNSFNKVTLSSEGKDQITHEFSHFNLAEALPPRRERQRVVKKTLVTSELRNFVVLQM